MKTTSLMHVVLVFCSLIFMNSAYATTPEQRLVEGGFTLPKPTLPLANYVTWRRVGNMLYLSGHGACEGKSVLGKLGVTLTVEHGYDAAQRVALCTLATIKHAVGDLARIKQVVQINGMVAATPDFTDHSKVMNGFSDLYVTAFGENGKAARVAVGMSSLPGNMAVEVSVILELHLENQE